MVDSGAGATRSWPGRIAIGIVTGESPQVFLAESDEVLGRLLALKLVAVTPAGELGAAAEAIRTALLDERWGDAVLEWMSATDNVVDGYPDEVLWTDELLDRDRTSLEIRLAPIFQGDDPAGELPGDDR